MSPELARLPATAGHHYMRRDAVYVGPRAFSIADHELLMPAPADPPCMSLQPGVILNPERPGRSTLLDMTSASHPENVITAGASEE